MREYTLCYERLNWPLTLSDEVVKLDHRERKVTMLLTVSKTDPAGRGARRTLACCDPSNCTENFLCPFWTCCKLVAIQEERTDIFQTDCRSKEVPLIGTVEDPFAFVEKTRMIETAKLDAALVLEFVPDATFVDVDSVTGHFMRRTGCKRLARMGHKAPLKTQLECGGRLR